MANLLGNEKDPPGRIEQYHICVGLSPTVLNVRLEDISASLKIVACAIIIAVSEVACPIIDQWCQW